MTIELDVVLDDAGEVVLALPPAWRAQAAAAALRKRAEETAGEDAAALARAADEVQRLDAENRAALAGRLVRRSWTLRRYTYGDKLRARREATTYDGGAPALDPEAMGVRLLAAAMGCEPAEVEAMPAALVPALVRELVDAMEPDPERLRFLSSTPTSSAPTPDAPFPESLS